MEQQNNEFTPTKNNSKFSLIIAVVVIVLVIAGGIYWWMNQNEAGLFGLNNEASQYQDVADWRIYKNDKYNFSLILPESWENYVVSNETVDWGPIGKADVILFGFRSKTRTVFNSKLEKIILLSLILRENRISAVHSVPIFSPIGSTVDSSISLNIFFSISGPTTTYLTMWSWFST